MEFFSFLGRGTRGIGSLSAVLPLNKFNTAIYLLPRPWVVVITHQKPFWPQDGRFRLHSESDWEPPPLLGGDWSHLEKQEVSQEIFLFHMHTSNVPLWPQSQEAKMLCHHPLPPPQDLTSPNTSSLTTHPPRRRLSSGTIPSTLTQADTAVTPSLES